MDSKYWKINDYVKVSQVPAPWEGVGESLEDRISLVGHIGIILEIDRDQDTWKGITAAMLLIGFHGGSGHTTIERNIEIESLTFVIRPAKEFTHFYHINC